MLFSNTLVSFVAAIALASSVTASTTPVRRWGSRDSGSGNNCNAKGSVCCATQSAFGLTSQSVQDSLVGILDPILNALVPVGLQCALAGTAGCNANTFCCAGVQNQDGSLVNVGLNCVDLPV